MQKYLPAVLVVGTFVLTCFAADHSTDKKRSEIGCKAYPTGGWRDHVSGHDDGERQLTQDLKHLLTPGDGYGKRKLLDVLTGKQIAEVPAAESVASYSPDGHYEITYSGYYFVKVRELPSRKLIAEFKFDGRVDWSEFSRDLKQAAFASTDGTVKVIDLSSGKTIINDSEAGSWRRKVVFSSDGNYVAASSWSGTAKVIELKTGKVISEIKHAVQSVPAPDGFQSWDGRKTYNFGSGPTIESIDFSPDGKSLLTSTMSGTHQVADIKTGKVLMSHRALYALSDSRFSKDGRSILVATDDGMVRAIDAKTGSETVQLPYSTNVSEPRFARDSESIIAPNGRGYLVFEPSWVCVPQSTRIGEFEQKFDGGAWCAESFASRKLQWAELTPLKDTLSSRETLHWLMRFQKPEGLDLSPEHLKIFLAIAKSPSWRENALPLIHRVMANMLNKSPFLYDALLREFPELATVANDSVLDCQNPSEKSEILKGVRNYLNRSLANSDGRIKRSELELLNPLRSHFSFLASPERERYIDRFSDAIASSASDNSELSGIFGSKIYYFAHRSVASFFGKDDHNPISDLTLVRQPDGFTPYILGSAPINGEVDGKTDFGFYLKKLAPIPVKKSGVGPLPVENPERFSWEHAGSHYKADIKLYSHGSGQNLIEDSDAFPYPLLWKDDKLSGIMIVGSNGGDEIEHTKNGYLSFYRNQGYHFESKPKEVRTYSFLKDQIMSGKVDYLIKHAHSDGDEKHLFRYGTSSEVWKGVKKNGNKTEDLYVVTPTSVNSTDLLGNSEFGDWIRQRQTPLVFFNASCSSHHKAVNEVAAAGKNLIDIPTLSTTFFFRDTPGYATRSMLVGFLAQKNYKDIRSLMEDDLSYKSRGFNVWIFPDEYDYKKNIELVVEGPIDTQIQLQKDGQPYFLDLQNVH